MGWFSKITHSIGKFFSSTVGKIVKIGLEVAALVALAVGATVVAAVIGLGLMLVGYCEGKYLEDSAQNMDNDIENNGHLLNTLANVNNPIPLLYGTVRVGGNVVFQKTAGEKNKYLYRAMTLGEGRLGKIHNILIDDKPITPAILVKKSNNEWVYKIISSDINAVKVTCKLGGVKDFEVNNAVIKLGQSKEIGSYVYDENEGWFFLAHTVRVVNIKVYAEFFKDDHGDLYLKVYIVDLLGKNNMHFNNVIITSYSTDNGNTWNVCKKKYLDKLDIIYFDGENLYKLDKNVNKTFEDNWILIDCNDNLFKEFVDNGFMVETYSGSDKYEKAFNMLRERHVGLLLVKLTYDSKVWTNIPTITVIIDGKQASTPFNKKVHTLKNPVEVLYDYMTNPTYGLGLSVDRLDLILDNNGIAIDGSWKLCYDYCEQKGFKFEGIIKSGKVIDIIKRILNHFRGEMVYYFGVFGIIFKDLPVEIQKGLTYPDVIEIEEGNPSFTVNYPDITTMYDQVEVSFIDPALNYKVNKIKIPENPKTDKQPNRTTLSLYGCDYPQAKLLGTYFLERSRLGITVSFITSHKYIDLQLGQAFKLTNKAWGIEEQWFRCTSIKPTIDGKLQISAIIEDEKLYDDVYEPYVYDIDLTEFLSPFELLHANVSSINALSINNAKSYVISLFNSTGLKYYSIAEPSDSDGYVSNNTVVIYPKSSVIFTVDISNPDGSAPSKFAIGVVPNVNTVKLYYSYDKSNWISYNQESIINNSSGNKKIYVKIENITNEPIFISNLVVVHE